MPEQDERVEWWFDLHGERKYRLTRAEVLRDLDACLAAYEEDAGPWAVGVSATLLSGDDWARTAEPEDPAAVLVDPLWASSTYRAGVSEAAGDVTYHCTSLVDAEVYDLGRAHGDALLALDDLGRAHGDALLALDEARAELAAERQRSRRLVEALRGLASEAREDAEGLESQAWEHMQWAARRIDAALAEYEGGQTDGK